MPGYFKLPVFFVFLSWLSFPINAQINPTNNIISVDISTFPQNPDYTYDSCFQKGLDAGIGSVGLFQNWTAIEIAPLTYNLSLFDIANIYYPAYNMPLDLTITPIHTNNLEVPSDLIATPYNNATFINRFNAMLDSVHAHMPDVTLNSLVIGSEYDVYLGSNTTLWNNYAAFYTAVAAHAKTLWPDVKMATEITFNGLINYNTNAQMVNASSDYIGVSYYALNPDFTVKPIASLSNDFETLIDLYPDKPLFFYQYGYPSSATCNSSDLLQRDFIATTFEIWDAHPTAIKGIDFTWLHDLDPVMVDYWGDYYGLTDAIFLEYLRTIGLRTFDGMGTDKPAIRELICQAVSHGFSDVDIDCNATITAGNIIESITIYPNPVHNYLSIHPLPEAVNEIIIYNIFGDKVSLIPVSGEALVDVSNLASGSYAIVIKAGNDIIATDNFVVIK